VAGEAGVEVVVTQIEVEVVVHLLGRRGDGVQGRHTDREVRGADAGLQPSEQVGLLVQPRIGNLPSGQRGNRTMIAYP
jgi:hypothetical protein